MGSQLSFGTGSSGRRVDSLSKPLAERMRPRSLDEIVGQEEVIGPASAFGKLVRSKSSAIPSIILAGPPGVGKTTIAQAVAIESNYRFVRLSGVLDGVKELRVAVDDAKDALNREGRPTLALVDEIHRFNKAQQDAFLPYVESGLLTIIGQTTENVSFRLRNALLSRLRVIELKTLTKDSLHSLLDTAMRDKERGLGSLNLSLSDEARESLVKLSAGDARRLLTALEWSAAYIADRESREIQAQDVLEAFGQQPLLFDQDGDYHYDIISAFIKSMRGSDPDAALYYMLRAIEAGEDPLFITRRMIIFASEDAGCDPRALSLALDVDRAVERVGLPEGKIPLAQGVVYLSCCSKSNASYKSLREMERVVKDNPELEVPRRLRNAPTDLMKEMGNADGYRYPHDYPQAFVPERYLPKKIENLRVYSPSDRGIEKQISDRLQYLDSLIKRERRED